MEINLDEDGPSEVDFHPSTNIVATSMRTGWVTLFRYAAQATPQEMYEVPVHESDCCSLCFTTQGNAIITGSLHGEIHGIDVETGIPISCLHLPNFHGSSPVSRIINLTESTVASSDTDGLIKVWDNRMRYSCNQIFKKVARDISDMAFAPDSMKLLATAYDGSLSFIDLRNNQIESRSEPSKGALLSVKIMKNGRKVVCGTQYGNLLMYSWGFFDNYCDCFDGFCPNSADGLVKVDEDRVVIGSDAGVMRLVGIEPNRIIGTIAEDSEYSPMDGFAGSGDKKFFSAIIGCHTLKLWNLDEELLLPPHA